MRRASNGRDEEGRQESAWCAGDSRVQTFCKCPNMMEYSLRSQMEPEYSLLLRRELRALARADSPEQDYSSPLRCRHSNDESALAEL